MTPRESVETILKGRVTDKIQFTIYGSKFPRCAVERNLRNQGLCVVQRDIPVYKTITPNVKVTSRTYTENGKILTRTEYETPVGNLYAITESAGFTSWCHKRLFAQPADYKPLLFLINDMCFEPNFDAFDYAQRTEGGDTFFRGHIGSEPLQSLISGYMGTESFCMQWHDNQDEIMKLYKALVAKRRQVYPICAESPALAFNYGGNVTPEIVGKQRFNDFYIPHYDEAAEVLHKKGKLIGVHFDANCKLFADSIADSKLDYIEAFTPSPDTDMTLAQARKAWPEKALWINFPSSVHLESVEYIEKTTHDLLDELQGDHSGFIMAITEDIPETRWQENLLAISRALSEHVK